MYSVEKQRMWKTIVVLDKEKNTVQFFNLDEKQKITPKMKHQKKRSIQLAKIGYYQNKDIKRIFDDMCREKIKSISSKNHHKNDIKESNQMIDPIDVNNFTNIDQKNSLFNEEEFDFSDNEIPDFETNDFYFNFL